MSTGINPDETVVATAWMQAPNLHADSIGANTLLAYYTPVIIGLRPAGTYCGCNASCAGP